MPVSIWLWFTVLFANFAEAMAEGRGKAQAESLRKARREVQAKRLASGHRGAPVTMVPATSLRKGDVFLVEAGDVIPADGEILEGVASVNESAITGESAPVIREAGGDRSSVTGGTLVLSDWLIVRVVANPGEAFLDRMIALVEGAKRQKTPNEIALDILLAGLTIIFLLATATLLPFSIYSVQTAGQGTPVTVTVLVALLVCLIPTTIGALLSAIGIAGMDRMIQANVIATSGRAVEAAGDVDVLLLDKTGTITLGQPTGHRLSPGPGGHRASPGRCRPARLSVGRDAGRAVHRRSGQGEVRHPRTRCREAGRQVHRLHGPDAHERGGSQRPPNPQGSRRTPSRRTSLAWVASIRSPCARWWRASPRGGRPPWRWPMGANILGVIQLKDIVKGGISERFAELRRMGIKTVMITGDNPLTAAAIAAEAGVDDFLAEATPEAKLKLIRDLQAEGRLVAMTGDGTNDAPALAQADVAVAMNSGTQAAKEAGNMVDLDSNPTKLLEVVETGKQMLMTRGALTTFSIANDVAKYFAIIPAAFATTYPALAALNIMRLATPTAPSCRR